MSLPPALALQLAALKAAQVAMDRPEQALMSEAQAARAAAAVRALQTVSRAAQLMPED
jgi:hypothetical protein